MNQPQLITFILGPLAGYLLGSIPFAFFIGKAHGVDIRKVGSGNVGATNLGRTLGMKYFWQAFILDGLKGFVPVFVMSLYVAKVNSVFYVMPPSWYPLGTWTPLLSGAAAMVGHVFPVWLKFRGGKGVSTAFGLVLGLWPLYTIAGIFCGLLFVLVFFAYRYISVASISSAIVFPLLVLFLGTRENVPLISPLLYTPPEQLYPLVYIGLAFAALIVIKHRSNIARLIKGTEPKFGQKKP